MHYVIMQHLPCGVRTICTLYSTCTLTVYFVDYMWVSLECICDVRVGVYMVKCVVRAIPKNIPLILCDFIKFMHDLYRFQRQKVRAHNNHGIGNSFETSPKSTLIQRSIAAVF